MKSWNIRFPDLEGDHGEYLVQHACFKYEKAKGSREGAARLKCQVTDEYYGMAHRAKIMFLDVKD